ncbi:DegT/DnrJ/EryC1/StrS family aminotransferase [Candidatus Woesearchaeota archaeon]|nr:DegT/DnrJ/EryC1/StrS family aminotransferase [Candidatus Woesearchaeota archaeon]
MINLSKPVIGEEEKKAVLDVLDSSILSQGSNIKEFEESFARYIEVKHAVATSSGTTALQAALLAHGIKKDDEVITTPFSFIATANSIIYVNAKPVFVDIEKDTFNINPDLIEEKITDKTKALLVVSLFGLTPDMDKICRIAKKHDLILIEDCAQSHGSEFKNKKAGSFGTGCFSFYPTKNMTTSEGGMITTNDEKIAETSRMIINHGSKIKYTHEILGYNFRMNSISAAIGIEQLKKLDSFNKKRIENANYLIENLKNTRIVLPKVKENYKHVFHQFAILVENREEVQKILLENNIRSDIHYPMPIFEQPLYKRLGYNIEGFNVSKEVCKKVLSIPVHPSLSKDDLDHIIKTLKSIQ